MTQTYRQWDAIITVTGFGGGENALRGPGGRNHLRPIYGRSSNYSRPDLGAFPFFGPGADHHRAMANGGAQAAQVVAAAIAEALVPLVNGPQKRNLYRSHLMQTDIRKKERTWTAGSGSLKVRGRRTKKWRRR